jgi:hypothetical protein
MKIVALIYEAKANHLATDPSNSVEYTR